MRPKPPARPNSPKPRVPTQFDPGSNRVRADANPPLLHQPQLTGTRRPDGDRQPQMSVADNGPGPSSVEITDIHSAQPALSHELHRYLLNPALLRNMGAADDQGIRYVVGRGFADIEGIGTVHVTLDSATGEYRVMDLYKKLPPGPVLVKNSGEATWRLAAPVESSKPSKRPVPVVNDSDSTVPNKKLRDSPVSVNEATSRLTGNFLVGLYPHMTHGQRVEHLRSYNLSPGQHVQLHDDLNLNPGEMPSWANQHKLRSMDTTAPNRFDPLYAEIEPLLLSVRNGASHSHLVDFDKSVSPAFLDAFLAKTGYLRNANDCLYRTDIPALFRADERTSFEFYNDGRMLPRLKHPRGATTAKPISATVSLESVKAYAGKGTDAPDPEYLRYNNQKNKYPGKKPGESDNDSGQSDDDWSDASDVDLDSERNYATKRHDQQFVFSYIIDTRGMEVVLNEENHLLNRAALDKGAWFPDDELEALISTSKSGIPSQRLWLLDSTFTRAAKVDDVAAEAQSSDWGSEIEARTHSGVNNQREYDELIDAVAKAGKPVLILSAGKDWFANDIVWPE